MAAMQTMATLPPAKAFRPPPDAQFVPARLAVRHSSAASADGARTAGAAWRWTAGISSGLALRLLATRRRAYGDAGRYGGYGGYGGRSGGLSPAEVAARTEAKRNRENSTFWSTRERAAQTGPPRRDDRYWNYEEKRLFQSAHVSKGINFEKYDDIPVETIGGQGTEEPVETFAEACEKFNVAQQLADNLARCGYDKPTPVQKYSMPAAMLGTDVMCSAQTGSGKTAAFLVPIVATILHEEEQPIENGPVAPTCVILAPTRELCQQIATEAKRICFRTRVRAVSVYGGADSGQQLKELADGCDIAICTPGRLEDFCSRGLMTMEKVRHLTLDEADRMLDMGFEPQIRKIIEEHGMPMPGTGEGERQTTMFSATFPQEMQDMALDFLDPGYLWIAVGQVGSVNSNVDQAFVDVTQEDRFDALLRSVEGVTDADGKIAKTLVFANMKVTVDDICWRLSENGIKAAPIHGGLSQPARDRAIANLKSGRVQALVATDVAARGLDLPGINHVVNYDLPPNADDYVHRIGRTGRIGNKGMATSMVGYNDGALKDIVTCLKEARQQDKGISGVPDWVEEKAFIQEAKGDPGSAGHQRPRRPSEASW
eukprot:CAMPEP_0175343064 /NCGR_PEP_ID=MMETSP0095-20121207/7159_1 /TAXON_ID=311494 /ORGANISM="Alexandrium monilatum, Strain CCMP3105" /LENGTH=598 /DNA_ID=CAMNT_0016640489 /DNA_START=202 /DNA_END=1996 /DNA_ORIENTATION=-